MLMMTRMENAKTASIRADFSPDVPEPSMDKSLVNDILGFCLLIGLVCHVWIVVIHNMLISLSPIRFRDWRSEKIFNGRSPSESGVPEGMPRVVVSSVSDKFQRGLESGSDRIKRFTGSIRSFSLRKFLADDEGSRKKILDPQGSFLQKWNKIFVLSRVFAILLDPLFFYIPIVDDEKKCLDLDPKLELTASILRSFTDVFYLIHVLFQFHTGFIAPSSRVFGRGVLVEDSWEIAKSIRSQY